MARKAVSGMTAWMWLTMAGLLAGTWVVRQTPSWAASAPAVLLGSFQGAYGTNSVGPGTLVDGEPWLSRTRAFHAWQGRGEAVTNLYAGGTPDSNPTVINALTTIWNQGASSVAQLVGDQLKLRQRDRRSGWT